MRSWRQSHARRTLAGLTVVAALLATAACGGSDAGATGAASDTGGGCEGYPSQPIDLIGAYAPGGGTDQVSRVISTVAAKHIDVPMRVIAKPGAGGALGTQEMLNAAPDGYTITLGNDGTLVGNPMLKEDVQYKFEDFAPVATVSETSFAYVVGADSPFKTWQDLIDASKKGRVSYGTTSVGGTISLFMGLLASRSEVSWAEVPFDGASEALIGAAGGNVDFSVGSSGTVVESVKGGLVRALAVSGNERLPALPDVPTLKEVGYDLNVPSFRVVAASAKVEQCKLDFLEDLMMKIGEDPEYQELVDKIEGVPVRVKDAAYTKQMLADYIALLDEAQATKKS